MTAFSTLYFILLTASTSLAKPIVQNIADDDIDPQSYLRMYGYLEEEDTTKVGSVSVVSSNNNDSVVSAIKTFQRFMDLNVTGIHDEATKRQMARPRCGVKDISKNLRQSQISQDYANSNLWNKTLRTYRFKSFASYSHISRPVQESILEDAFYEWSKHVPLTFEKVCETCQADIEIEFVDDDLDNHLDDGQKVNFNRDDIAHAMFPWHAYPTFIHFNKKTNFTDSYSSDISRPNLFHVALHEIGHTLGLDHLQANRESVMYSYFPDPYDRSRADYLKSVDQELLQAKYGRREKTILSSCSTWSTLPRRLNITTQDLKNSQNLITNQADKAVETGNDYQLLTRFLLEHKQWYHSASDHFRQQKNATKRVEAKRSRTITRSIFKENHFKSSGTVSENEFGQIQAIFIDVFDNLYISDYFNNRVLKYDAATTDHEKTIVAENLNAPRGLYVTNDSSTLYVTDNKGVHRFRLKEKESNLGASTLLFCLDSSSEIYSMIVDEDDFNTIYLYDIARQRIQRCRHFPHNWKCETIIDLAATNNGLTEQAFMFFDPKGDLSILDSTKSVMLQYKHDKNGCQSMLTSIKPPSTSTASPSSSSTTTRTETEQEPRNDAMIRYGSSYGGTGGRSFDDAVVLKLSQMTPCIGVEVFWITHLFAIRFIYKQNDSLTQKVYYGHGGNPFGANSSLSNETFLLSADEQINKVTLYVDKILSGIRCVVGIQFDTTKIRRSRVYGVKVGEKFTESYEGFILGYAKGKSGSLIDMLQFVWYKQVTTTVEEYRHFAVFCPTSSTTAIHSAIYRSKQDYSACSKSAIDVVQEICFNKASCSFSVRNEIFDIDPCPHSERELQVTYTCIPYQTTTVYTSDPSSSWAFDNSAADSIANLHGVSVNSPSYVTSGITGSGYALSLNRKNSTYITISTYKNLTYTSFTVEMWIYPTILTHADDYGLFSQKHNLTIDHLLHYVIRDGRLRMGFFHDDAVGKTQLTTNTWYHVAFVYDYPSRTQIVYLNGIQDGIKNASGPYLGETGAINIGMTNNYDHLCSFNGYIDQTSLTMRSKSASEILVDATLTAWHSFDNGPFHDSGPLGLSGTAANVDVVPGRVNQALSFTSNSSYYQVGGFVLLGISNYSFSISLWVKPASIRGATLVHLSTTANGQGWCADVMGFSSRGQIIVSGWNTRGQDVVGPVLDANVWTHVVSTFSTTNGVRLYVNGILIDSTGAMPYRASEQINILTLANPLQAVSGGSCNYTSIATGVYFGYLDELRVYSRELNAKDVNILANP